MSASATTPFASAGTSAGFQKPVQHQEGSSVRNGIGITLIVAGALAVTAGAIVALAYFKSDFAQTIGATAVNGTLAGRVTMIASVGGGLLSLGLGIYLGNSGRSTPSSTSGSPLQPYSDGSSSLSLFGGGFNMPIQTYIHEPLVIQDSPLDQSAVGWYRTLAATDCPTAKPVQVAIPNEVAAIQDSFALLIDHLKRFDPRSGNLAGQVYISQFIHNVNQLIMPADMKNRCFEWAISMLLEWKPSPYEQSISKEILVHASHILYCSLSEEKLRRDANSKSNGNAIPVPGDGNCMLWACIFGEKLLRSQNPQATASELAKLSTVRRNSGYFPQAPVDEMMEIRGRIVTKFIESMNDRAFRIAFTRHVCTVPEIYEKVVTGSDCATFKQAEDVVLVRGREDDIIEPTLAMKNNYADLLLQDRVWNSEFEANLVAQVLKRPIVMFGWSVEQRRYILDLIAGREFLEREDGKFIYIRHHGGHYNCILP